MVINVHDRKYQASSTEIAAVVASLSSSDDRLWPHERWPRMRLDPGLTLGGCGGHGPVRYRVEGLAAHRVVFRFTGPPGFDGRHAFDVIELGETTTLLRHELRMRPRGWARLTWPLLYRPLHDALIEDALDKVALDVGDPPGRPQPHGRRTRILRRLAMALLPPVAQQTEENSEREQPTDGNLRP